MAFDTHVRDTGLGIGTIGFGEYHASASGVCVCTVRYGICCVEKGGQIERTLRRIVQLLFDSSHRCLVSECRV